MLSVLWSLASDSQSPVIAHCLSGVRKRASCFLLGMAGSDSPRFACSLALSAW